MQGSYRYMIVRPQQFSYEIVDFEEKNEDLLVIDPSHPHFGETVFKAGIKENKGGEHKALKLQFSLRPSAYATMLIREITKLETAFNWENK